MFVLGIVGSIAGGKSTAARYLSQKGAAWINADAIARISLDDPGVKAKLTRRWGDVVDPIDEQINRQKVAAKVFGADSASLANLRFLESVVHPMVRKKIKEQLRQNILDRHRVSLLDVPLLFESDWHLVCDQVWCVDASQALRAQRCQARGWEPDELARRESRQLAVGEKIRQSAVTLRNDSSLESLHQQLDLHWQRLVASLDKLSPNAGPC